MVWIESMTRTPGGLVGAARMLLDAGLGLTRIELASRQPRRSRAHADLPQRFLAGHVQRPAACEPAMPAAAGSTCRCRGRRRSAPPSPHQAAAEHAVELADACPVFDVLHDELPQLASDVSSFIDAFDEYRSAQELRALAGRGLKRVFVGVESGDEATLALLGKPATVAGVGRLVETLKAGGLSVGVIFLAGLGATHVEASTRLAASLPLDERDLLYVSPLVVDPGGPLARQLIQRGLLQPQATIDAEADVLRAKLRGRAKVARYDVRRWVYM
jgi:hypothetical protein